MSGQVCLVYHPLYDGRGFSPVTRSWGRYREARALFAKLGIDRSVTTVQPPLATMDELTLAHPQHFVERIRGLDAMGTGVFDTPDTVAWAGVFDRARAAVGATMEAVRLVTQGRAKHVFNPGGGLHHAFAERARGFCIFNDIAIAVRSLAQAGFEKVAVIDIDGHHGDGTQEILYDHGALHISMHQYDGRFFPGTGSVDETGWGVGHGLTLNIPLPRHTGEAAYLDAFRSIVPTAIRAYSPEVILLNFGVDGHHDDPLVKLRLGIRTYRFLAMACHELAHEVANGRIIVTGSGGYDPDVVSRCWSVLLATLTGQLSGVPALSPSLILDAPSPVATSEAILDALGGTDAWRHPFECLLDHQVPTADPKAGAIVGTTIHRIINEVLPLHLTKYDTRSVPQYDLPGSRTN